ncbi:hypothetical protein Fmac_018404 [Flemingia macrophylla]|uniref:Uncharacterized protein n=1 Tax=Flemingia macrophylla TaxID=520843 RepID=A0ABD1M4Y1_9FABA
MALVMALFFAVASAQESSPAPAPDRCRSHRSRFQLRSGDWSVRCDVNSRHLEALMF